MGEFDKINQHLNDWKVTRLIGKGSFGAVYEIEREEVDIKKFKSALKVVTIPQDRSEVDSMLSAGTDEATIKDYYEGVVKDIVSEYVLMSDLKGTSNIVSYENHKRIPHEDGIGCDIFIRMELLTPMFEYIRDHGMDEQTAIQVGIDICSALELCHRHNILHRDIKPGNIFWSENGNFKLGDFGIARTVEKASGELSRKGTYQYMAPEVYYGGDYDKRADIYSLGIVLYYLMNNNRIPFLPPAPAPVTHDDMETAIRMRLSKKDGRMAEVPPIQNASYGFNTIIKKACAANPTARFSSASEMKKALEDLQKNIVMPPMEDEGTAYMDESRTTLLDEHDDFITAKNTEPEAPKKKLSPALLIVIAVVVIGAIVGLVFALGGNDSSNGSGDSSNDSVAAESDDSDVQIGGEQYYSDSNGEGQRLEKDPSWPDINGIETDCDFNSMEHQTVISRDSMKLERVFCFEHWISVSGSCTGDTEFGIYVFNEDGYFEKTLVEIRNPNGINREFNEKVELKDDGYHFVKIVGMGPYDLHWDGIY